MAHVRRRGQKWQAIVTLPTGRQTSRTDRLKKVVEAWAKEVETDLLRERWHDPRPARATTLTEWRAQWLATRMVEPVTARKDASHWRTHVEPRWGAHRLALIRRADVQAWVAAMTAAGTGAHTVAGAFNHLGAMLEAAVVADPPLLAINPTRGVRLPRTDAGRLRFFTRQEAAAIEEQLDEPYRTLFALACQVGLRWGELAGLDAASLDADRATLVVRQVLTRTGLRPYAKSTKSHRVVPVPARLLGPLRELSTGGTLLFTGANGLPLDEANHRQRVWVPALQRAGVAHAPFHTTRHTAASWLVMAGVDLYRVQALLGHESYRTTEKYAHLAPNAHDVLRQAWGDCD